jgi:hypothetical protein
MASTAVSRTKIPTKTHNYSASEQFDLPVLGADHARFKAPHE